MYEYNNENLITGYIKELLSSFNLPKYKVFVDNKTKLINGRKYIYNNTISKYTFENNIGKFERLSPYVYGKNYTNATTNLIINSSNYDEYTHTYLGNYLRFIRDYNGLDLMPLYNCYLNTRATGLNYSVILGENNTQQQETQ